MSTELKDFYDKLPKKRIAAMGIIRNDAGKILIVKPTYRDKWLLPGGIVEQNESPWQCCTREILEELGIKVPPVRFLAVDYKAAKATTDKIIEGLFFVFDCGKLPAEKISRIRLPKKELSNYLFADLEEAKKLLVPALAKLSTWKTEPRDSR